MVYRFSGEYEALKQLLQPLDVHGRWQDVNENQKQFRHNNGGIINWFPSTGSLNFQGKPQGKKVLEQEVAGLLASQPAASENATTVKNLAPPEPPETPIATSPEPAKPELAEAASVQLGQTFSSSELIVGLVGAIGTELKKVSDVLKNRLKVSGYTVNEVHISSDIISKTGAAQMGPFSDEYSRVTNLMDAGNQARLVSQDSAILALGAAAWIASKRAKDGQGNPEHAPRVAYLLNSLKHPDEVQRLREIYPQGFYLIGVHADELRRHQYLVDEKRMKPDDAQRLMLRDEDEHLPYGQRVADTFHMSDFFVRLDGDDDQLKNSLWRILKILFSYPYVTPTFDEYAMFMAFAASLRSADLSRQVGAVVAREQEIVATGANDCPKAGGGLYWPAFDSDSGEIKDDIDGRDYMRGEDANKAEQQKIIEGIVAIAVAKDLDETRLREVLDASRIPDLTEFGRVVHAEMEALLCCARNNVSTRGAVLYCTTFPCHNCAKHLIAAGIMRVVYIEPYQKSKASEFHSDAISLGFDKQSHLVRFEPFVGVGPRRFFDLFSMRLGSGYPVKRKDSDGQVLDWKPEGAKLRLQMLPCSYLDLELRASDLFGNAFNGGGNNNG